MRTICLVVYVLEGAWLCSSLLYVRLKTFLATKLPLIDSQNYFELTGSYLWEGVLLFPVSGKKSISR